MYVYVVCVVLVALSYYSIVFYWLIFLFQLSLCIYASIVKLPK